MKMKKFDPYNMTAIFCPCCAERGFAEFIGKYNREHDGELAYEYDCGNCGVCFAVDSFGYYGFTECHDLLED